MQFSFSFYAEIESLYVDARKAKNANNSNSDMTLAREQKTFLNTTANLNKHDAFVISFHDLPTSLFIRSFFQATYMCRLALFLSTMSH